MPSKALQLEMNWLDRAIGYVARGLQWGYQPGKSSVRILDHIGAAR